MNYKKLIEINMYLKIRPWAGLLCKLWSLKNKFPVARLKSKSSDQSESRMESCDYSKSFRAVHSCEFETEKSVYICGLAGKRIIMMWLEVE